MKKPLTFAAAALFAQSPDEKPGQEPQRVPTIEELDALIANSPAPPVPIDPFDARTTAQSMLDAADDEEIVWLYLSLREAKNEYSTIKREIGRIEGSIRANRERRERSQRAKR